MRTSLLLLLCLIAVPVFAESVDPIESMMDLWKYDNPKQSAVRFISLLDSAEVSPNKDYLPALLSQVARSYAMRGDFKSAHEQLNELELLIQDTSSLGQVFYLLERGRALKAGGDKTRARILFKDAFIIADRLGDVSPTFTLPVT